LKVNLFRLGGGFQRGKTRKITPVFRGDERKGGRTSTGLFPLISQKKENERVTTNLRFKQGDWKKKM